MKILVVDDHALVRAGLCQVLQGLEPLTPLAPLTPTAAVELVEVIEAADAQRAFALAASHPDLDLVLLDYHLPDMNGLAALQVFGKRHPELPVVILSGSANPSIAQRALAHGAAGFVTKSGLSDALLQVLRRVLQGEVVAPPEFPEFCAGSADNSVASKRKAPVFTPRQQEVLQLLLAGCSNRDISEQLALSDETVKNHVSSVLRGFGVKTRTQAALEAGRWGYGRSASAGR